jgi:hypothetical protein
MHLHDWLFELKTFRAIHGDTNGGETGTNDDVLREALENIGATIVGRNMFGGGHGSWEKDPWKGWWGDNPPYHHPVFVLTHFAREPLPMPKHRASARRGSRANMINKIQPRLKELKWGVFEKENL